MTPLVHECATAHTPDSLAHFLLQEPGLVLLRSSRVDNVRGRYSLLAIRPFLTVRTRGSACEVLSREGRHQLFGNPWTILAGLLARYELLDEIDFPFPLGACVGFWGYDLNQFIEPKLARRTRYDLDLPDLHAGFYDSLVVFDHLLQKTWIVSTGFHLDGTRTHAHAQAQAVRWRQRLQSPAPDLPLFPPALHALEKTRIESSLTRSQYERAVEMGQRYIRAGDIYQVNLAQRFRAPLSGATPWSLYQRLAMVSPTAFAAYLEGGDFQLASASPELFLRLSGARVVTRPIKGTRPRGENAMADTRLSYELQTSPKELAELIMITDLLRNDLGKVCEFGSVQVPELTVLERYAHVQHLVSTVEGQLRTDVTHLQALAAAFPGGSITGAPKVRAMEIIDELEPVARGPYTGALGYLGFNRESQFSILIRTAVCCGDTAYFHAGAGIVADSSPAAEYEETLAKAAGFFQAMTQPLSCTQERVPSSRAGSA